MYLLSIDLLRFIIRIYVVPLDSWVSSNTGLLQFWLPMIISLIGTLAGAIIGGWMAYGGSLRATKIQLAAGMRESARAWFHQYYLIEGIDRVWAHTVNLKQAAGLGYMGIREIEPPAIPTDALLKLYDLFSCEKIFVLYSLLDLAARPVNAPGMKPPPQLGIDLAQFMDKVFLTLLDARSTLETIEINTKNDIALIRKNSSVAEVGKRFNQLRDDLDHILLEKYGGFFYRR